MASSAIAVECYSCLRVDVTDAAETPEVNSLTTLKILMASNHHCLSKGIEIRNTISGLGYFKRSALKSNCFGVFV